MWHILMWRRLMWHRLMWRRLVRCVAGLLVGWCERSIDLAEDGERILLLLPDGGNGRTVSQCPNERYLSVVHKAYLLTDLGKWCMTSSTSSMGSAMTSGHPDEVTGIHRGGWEP